MYSVHNQLAKQARLYFQDSNIDIWFAGDLLVKVWVSNSFHSFHVNQMKLAIHDPEGKNVESESTKKIDESPPQNKDNVSKGKSYSIVMLLFKSLSIV